MPLRSPQKMKRSILHGDIIEVSADALIYSTNVQLMLSGGVGACLLKKFGNQFQNDLFRQIDQEGRKLAEVGEVFFSDMSEGPWRVIVHSIATDPFYHTEPEVVRKILRQTFTNLAERGNVSSVVMSPLGAGYGDLDIQTFLNLVTEESSPFERSCIGQLIVCCDYEPTFRDLIKASELIQADWENPGHNKIR